MHSFSKYFKFKMYKNSNGSVEHGNSTADPGDLGIVKMDGSSEEVKVEKQNDENEGVSEEEVNQEEEDEEATFETGQDAAATRENIIQEELVPKTNPNSEADDHVDHPEEEMETISGGEGVLDAKQDEEEISDEGAENVESIAVEVLKHDGEAKEMVAGKSRTETTAPNLDLCRVCMGTEELSDIFQLEGPFRISDIIMKVCTNIRITARDHLPHKICERCLGQVRIVNEFKNRCEISDKELRKNLKRSANKSRRQNDFIVVNCPMSDSDKEDDEPVDDDEYKVSQSEVESEPATSDDSFSPPNKRKRTPRKRGRAAGTPGRRGRYGRKPKHMAIATASHATYMPKRGPGRPPKNATAPTLSNIVYIEAPQDSSSSGEEEEVKRRRRKRGDNPCPKCDEVLPSQLALKQHLKSHPEDRFNCDRCRLYFKTERALNNHIERHKKAENVREEKRREREERAKQRLGQRDSIRSSDLDDSKSFLSASYSSMNSEKKKKPDPSAASSGRDLFKCVAPLTSTYWSDSFSD